MTSGALDGTTGTLNAAGLTAFPELRGRHLRYRQLRLRGLGDPGAPFTSLMTENCRRADVLAGVYQHPGTDPQAGVSELALFFDYNSLQTQWLEMAPG